MDLPKREFDPQGSFYDRLCIICGNTVLTPRDFVPLKSLLDQHPGFVISETIARDTAQEKKNYSALGLKICSEQLTKAQLLQGKEPQKYFEVCAISSPCSFRLGDKLSLDLRELRGEQVDSLQRWVAVMGEQYCHPEILSAYKQRDAWLNKKNAHAAK